MGPSRAGKGFEGSVSNLSLSDVLQLEGQNRFSGSISVSHESLEGVIFLQAGEVVHAETGVLKGEDAFAEILGWPKGNFVVHPNVGTFSRTVQKGLSHLLLEAHRRFDESRKAAPAAPPPGRTPPAAARGAAAVTGKVRAVPGVTQAVLLNSAGTVIGDASPAEELLAARSLYLATTIASQLGETLRLGELLQASLSSPAEQLLLLRSRDSYLAIGIESGTSLASAEAGIRQALSKPGGQ